MIWLASVFLGTVCRSKGPQKHACEKLLGLAEGNTKKYNNYREHNSDPLQPHSYVRFLDTVLCKDAVLIMSTGTHSPSMRINMHGPYW